MKMAMRTALRSKEVDESSLSIQFSHLSVYIPLLPLLPFLENCFILSNCLAHLPTKSKSYRDSRVLGTSLSASLLLPPLNLAKYPFPRMTFYAHNHCSKLPSGCQHLALPLFLSRLTSCHCYCLSHDWVSVAVVPSVSLINTSVVPVRINTLLPVVVNVFTT